jgi:hypothetical protein
MISCLRSGTWLTSFAAGRVKTQNETEEASAHDVDEVEALADAILGVARRGSSERVKHNRRKLRAIGDTPSKNHSSPGSRHNALSGTTFESAT